MIQRIQTLYLALASLSLGSLFMRPVAFAELTLSDGTTPAPNSGLFDGFLNVTDNNLLMFATFLSIAALLIAIFLFSKRGLQTIFATIGNLGSCATFVLGGFEAQKAIQALPSGVGATLSYGLAAPVLAIILSLLAIRNIRRDEKIVRSADRLR
jgi:hypothetical protein